MLNLANLLAFSSIALLLASNASPVSASPSPFHHPVHARRSHSHLASAVQKRSKGLNKRSTRCRARNNSTDQPASTSESHPAPLQTPSSQSQGNNNNTPDTDNSPPPQSGSGSGKGCIAWALGNDQSLKNVATDKMKFVYTWTENTPQLAASLNLEPMPMLWGDASDKVSAFKSKVKPGYTGKILGFNEPNQAGQANMSPGQAAQVWKDNIEPLCKAGAECISPATTSAPAGITWMQQFLDACNGGCSIDGIALHWYGTDANQFMTYVNLWHTTFNKPIFVTEYACQSFTSAPQCSADQTNSFHATVAKWMDEQSFVTAYCPFGWMHDMSGVNPTNQLLGGNNQPTALGARYTQDSWN